MDTKTKMPLLHSTVMGPNYSYVFDFEREFEHEETKEWFLVSSYFRTDVGRDRNCMIFALLLCENMNTL